MELERNTRAAICLRRRPPGLIKFNAHCGCYTSADVVLRHVRNGDKRKMRARDSCATSRKTWRHRLERTGRIECIIRSRLSNRRQEVRFVGKEKIGGKVPVLG